MDVSTLTLQLNASFGVAQRNLADVSHEESLLSPGSGGNCLNWIAGHLMASRNDLLEVLGKQRLWGKEHDELYRRGSEPITAANARPLAELTQAFRDSHEAVLSSLQAVTPERMAEPAPFSPGNNPDETVGTLLALFAFHEAYHVGQTGVLRRVCGHPGAIG